MAFEMIHTDCFRWLRETARANSFQAIVTDPPYGLEEFSNENIEKLKNGKGGIWRIPPAIGGSKRAPLPRFTVFPVEKYPMMQDYFNEWANLVRNCLVPGGHIFIATNPLFLHMVSSAITNAGFEPRGIVVRVVRTLRGGFRPKGAEEEFEDVCSMPRACWEPWAIFRKPLERDLTLAENLRKYRAGALRRNPDGMPFTDVIISERTPDAERKIAPHPTLKPQSFMRRIVWAALPTGKGKVLDTFSGAGSTLAAAAALGYDSVGLELSKEYCAMAREAIPKLALHRVNPWRIKGNNGEIIGALKTYGMGLDQFPGKENPAEETP